MFTYNTEFHKQDYKIFKLLTSKLAFLKLFHGMSVFSEIFLSVPQRKRILWSNIFQNAELKLKQMLFYNRSEKDFHSSKNLLNATIYHALIWVCKLQQGTR